MKRYRYRILNLIIVSTYLSMFIMATVAALGEPNHYTSKVRLSFYKDFENETLGNSICVFINQLIYTYQYEFPFLASGMIGILYYEFSEFLHQFHEDLKLQFKSLNHNKIGSLQQVHTFLYQVGLEVQNGTSMICFVIICCQMTSMYVTLSVFNVFIKKKFSSSSICRMILSFILGPGSLACLTLCSSKISTQFQKVQRTILLLKDELIRRELLESKVFDSLNTMLEKQINVMTASGFVELTPKSLLAMIGSLISYTLLIVNLKQ
ncbi:hypothetical protein AVEN_6980-1 [Araneus ventricosus]|uniref:Gustatory receptor n=1 Tax=Araneus ventricosus TaxID=182803 RepID=A0A4Y2I4D7_ARAVE|nr:hypothetical protein AVEN_6980-1 [Araneus ventricosus]